MLMAVKIHLIPKQRAGFYKPFFIQKWVKLESIVCLKRLLLHVAFRKKFFATHPTRIFNRKWEAKPAKPN